MPALRLDHVQSLSHQVGPINEAVRVAWPPPVLSKKIVIEQFVSAFGAAKCGIVERTSKNDRINAGRTVIKSCEFHKSRCEEGLDGLRAWHFKYDPDLQAFSKEPEHDWASHPSDAFTYGCQVMQNYAPPVEETKRPKWWHEQTAAEVFALDKPTEQKREWV